MMKNLLFVMLGGGFGSGFRYLLAHFAKRQMETSFPLATFTINITGSLLIGIILGYYSKESNQNEYLKLLLATGFCGGFTTFSAFTFENLSLIQTNQTGTAFIYIGLSLVLGILAVWLGMMIGKI